MSDPLTAAVLREHRERLKRVIPDLSPEFWEAWGDRLGEYTEAVSTSAAARAVDQALDPERVAEALCALGIGHYRDWTHADAAAITDPKHEATATALVAHLRGARP